MYEIKGELGRGGMATVYRGYDPGFDREVAIKVLPREFLHDASFRERFRHEAKIIGSLEHPAIVPVYYFGEEEGQPFIVMRYMAGGSLAERLAGGPLPLHEITRILGALAPALDEAHERGILHRDLKPGNILFDQRNAPYIADFGIAKLMEGSQALSSTGGLIGTPAYMSPEQARGEKLDGRSDIYALGAILFEMLTGQLPYQADTPMGMALRHVSDPIPTLREANRDLPAHLQAIIDRAMAKQRDGRYATARELVNALQTPVGASFIPAPTELLQQEIPILAPPQPLVQPREARRGFPLAWLLSLILLLGAATFLLQNHSGAPEVTPTTGDAQTDASPAPTLPRSPVPTLSRSPAPTLPTLPTLSLGSTRLSEIDDMTLVFVPAGEFLRGSVDGDTAAKDDEKPQRTLSLDAFWIDQTEVTNAMYERCVADEKCQPPDPTGSATRERYFDDADFADFPVINVRWNDAGAYCTWAGRRLPTEAEWEKAARGTDGQLFPWGDEEATGERLNFCDQNCSFDYKNGNIDDGFSDTSSVGSYPEGISPFEALDMSGNVWEWVNDSYQADYYTVAPDINPPGPEISNDKVHRGGAWNDIVRSVTARGVLGANERQPFLGFRCAMTP
ncbi:MAG: SUMF1/EgtB/PvdO family nonheme iron enzyme [Ardenticatenales bacterium]|nr:SUMF1/EgtB/PvdO family nonheme iron enzyme [Ardenticatenales bacterium]